MSLWSSPPQVQFGSYSRPFPIPAGKLMLDRRALATHKHVIGVSGSGKSKLLESLFLQLVEQGIAATFLDPHADSAEALLGILASRGYFRRPDAYKRLLYIDFADSQAFLPFNILSQPKTDPHTISSQVLEAFHRAWPALGDGAAPQFDNLVLAGTLVLIENGLPLSGLHRLLTDKSWRDRALEQVSDGDVVAFFTDRFDRWSRTETPQMIESTLRRLFLLTFSPILKASLGSTTENALDFRALMDAGTSVIINLGGVHDQDARRLLGCLLVTGYETAALSRTDLDPSARVHHHLLLDEFSDYSAQSEEALSRTLSLTRKFGLFSTMAHQTWSQTSARLQGALQNVGVRVALKVGRQDAEILAKSFGAVDPYRLKKDAASATGQPVFLELPAQWEQWTQELMGLKPRHALVSIAGRPTLRIVTPTVPSPRVDSALLRRIKEHYRTHLLRPRSRVTTSYDVGEPSSRTRRIIRVE